MDDANAVKVFGSFFGTTFDPLRDPVTGTTRFGAITLDGLGMGLTELRFAVGFHGIAFVGLPDDTPVNFGWLDPPVAGDDKGAQTLLPDATVIIEVPEPCSVSLLGVGAIGLMVTARRARRRRRN